MRPLAAWIRTVVVGCLLLGAALAASACGSPDAPQPSASPRQLQYVNNEFHFTLTNDSRFESFYPFKASDVALKVGFFDKDGSPAGAAIPDGLWITLIDKKSDADRNADQRSRQLKRLVADLEAQGSGPGKQWRSTMVGGLPAAWNEQASSRTGKPRISYLIVGRRNVYLLAGSATKQTWPECRPLFVAAIESFREL